jgi:hypothetical protein
MNIDHPLWAGSMLGLQAKFMNEERMREEVRAYVRSKRRCDDLTPNERSFVKKLEEWHGDQI